MTYRLTKLYEASEREDVPIYEIATASRYLDIPAGTLESWVRGRPYPKKSAPSGKGLFEPLIEVPDPDYPLLSFTNLVEAHVLRAFRSHSIDIPKIRRTILHLKDRLQTDHPLAAGKFSTDGMDVFLGESLENVSTPKQEHFEAIMRAHVLRIRFGPERARGLFPFSAGEDDPNAPRVVYFDPYIAYGRPVLDGTGIPTDAIVSRFLGREDPHDIADDYGVGEPQVLEVIRWEMRRRAMSAKAA